EGHQEIDQKHPQNQFTGMETVPAFVHASTSIFLASCSYWAGVIAVVGNRDQEEIKPAAAVRRRSY
ncbi:MAG: hypothetical protein WB818_19665, partial [Desulfobacterales bacterium]